MKVSRHIDASTGRVWRLVSDLSHWAELLPTMDAVKPLNDVPGAGARFEVRQPGLPSSVYTVTEWRPGRGFTWEASGVGVKTVASHTIEPDGDGTLLTLELVWSGPLAWIVRRVYGRTGRRFVQTEADTFAEVAERRGGQATKDAR